MGNLNTEVSENTKVILLLTSFFNSNEWRQFKPLTINGYGYFARWLFSYGYKPIDLLEESKLKQVFTDWSNPDSHIEVKKKLVLNRLDDTIKGITYDRVSALLGRGTSLSMALDKWSAAGIWILDRSHPYYPAKIKSELKDKAPAILFGVGNHNLLNQQAIGFVGSRNCEQLDLDATSHYVEQINKESFQVISGAAKGVDTHAMLSSLKSGSTCIGIVSDSLFAASASTLWRQYLKSKQLVLISPFFPDAKFTAANAMERNKYIYLLSSATVVICSDEETGGTWEGAKENLKKAWVPLLVSAHRQPNSSGNQALIDGIKSAKVQAKEVNLSSKFTEWQKVITDFKRNKDNYADQNIEPQASLFSSSEQYLPESNTNESGNLGDEVSFSDDLFGTDLPQSASESEKCSESYHNLVRTKPDNQTKDSSNYLSMPLIDVFYRQLIQLFEEQQAENQQAGIDFDTINERFPDLQIISQTALDNCLKYWVKTGLLIQPNSQKRYHLPEKYK